MYLLCELRSWETYIDITNLLCCWWSPWYMLCFINTCFFIINPWEIIHLHSPGTLLLDNLIIACSFAFPRVTNSRVDFDMARQLCLRFWNVTWWLGTGIYQYQSILVQVSARVSAHKVVKLWDYIRYVTFMYVHTALI